MKGWVYVITNKAMPGLIKVGYSMSDPELRAAELNHTGSPHPYDVDYEVLVDEPRDVEQTVHGRLRNQRERKEWFRCTSEEAIAAIKAVVGTKAQVENFKRADRAKAEAIKQQDDDTATATEEFRLKQLIGIEQFEQVNDTLANITIKGIPLRLPTVELLSYRKLRMQFIQKGIFLPDIKESEWHELLSHLFKSNPVPQQAMAPMSSVSILGEYLNAHIDERLVVTRLNTGMTAQNARPTKERSQRYDKETHTLWVSRKHIKQYLEAHQFDYNRTKDELYALGILISTDSRKVLGAGTDYTGGQTPCWKIRTDHPALGALIS